MKTPRLLIHGGAGSLEGGACTLPDYAAALAEVNRSSFTALLRDGARSAVLHAVKSLEANPIFNAGTGSKLQQDGQCRMSAALISSDSGRFSGVINIRNIKHPIEAAQLLADAEHSVLCGEPAADFARQHQFEYYDPITPQRWSEFSRRVAGETGTVGAVALDADGVICAGTSTGGVGCEIPGRVSDSATVAGTYASEAAGAAATGIGEEIVNLAVAARLVTLTEAGIELSIAARSIAAEGSRRQMRFGLIAVDRNGALTVNTTSGVKILHAWHTQDSAGTFLDGNGPPNA